MRILVLGASGMLGSAIFKTFSDCDGFVTYGTLRSPDAVNLFDEKYKKNLIQFVDCEKFEDVITAFLDARPEIVINCIGLIKQISVSSDPLRALPLNSIFPHKLAQLCELSGARLIHISTDCVFSGKVGMYKESDVPDSTDVYGVSKALGEIKDLRHVVTLRTSIIGHELKTSRSLVDWFLDQNGVVNGYTKAIFSGFPTVELARIIKNYVIPLKLCGLYNVSSDPITKYDLLLAIKKVYKKDLIINECEDVVVDRSLDSTLFMKKTGYIQKPWIQLIEEMHASR